MDTNESGKRGTLLAWFYIASGAIGALVSATAIMNSHLSAGSAFAWLLLLAQLAAAIFGGVEVLKNQVRGYQILYLVSLSCIPVFGSSLLIYYSALGLGLMPFMSFGVSYSETGFLIKFGYESTLQFTPNVGGTFLGVNLVAIGLALHLRRYLKSVGIRAWPLVQPIRPEHA